MKDYNRAENKVLKPDAARTSADKSAYSPAKSKASGASETGSSAKLGGSGSSGNKSRHHRYGGLKDTALVVLLTFSMVFASLLGAFADDLVNTVPTSEAPGGNFYSGTINTGLKEDGPYGEVPYRGYGPDYGPYNVTGVYQSQSATSPTSFAAGLPLGTIFIDQSKIKDIYPEPVVVSKDTSIIAGLGKIGGTTRMGYDGTKPGAIKMVPGKINELKGDLFKVTFEDAAILPNGDRADLVITYSNARIVIDERYMAAPVAERYYHGAVSLAQGNAFSYGGTDETNMSTTYSDGTDLVNTTAKKYGATYSRPSNTDNNRVPATGLTMDATYQIVNKDTTPAAGTFVFAISGINLDRDPDVGGGNNVAKPLWYSYNENFSGANGKDHSFFSEAMEITGGQASDYVYVRPNTSQEDNPDKITGVKGQYFYPNVSLHNGNIKFISNALDKTLVGYDGLSGNDNSYNAGFVTLADAATGFKVTATGHGSAKNFMNSLVFNSKQIWYRYTSSTGRHGSIRTMSEGNYKGTLNDGGDILEPEGYFEDGSATHNKKATYVVTEGKDVYYTMTPDTGYKLKTLKIGKTFDANGVPTEYEEVKFNGESVNTMKKGDQLEVTTKAGKKGLLKYNGDGTYVFKFEYALHNEAIHVEWEPVTADILVSKVWDDEDDKDGMREDAYKRGKFPFFRLEYSINGGRTWNPVNNNTIGGTTAQPSTTISPEQVPSGKDEESGSPTQGKYLDGTYTIDRGTTGTYESSAASPQPAADQLVEISETCDGLPVFENQKTFKKYVKIEGSYREVTSVDHPYTWQNLPVYKYDVSGDADRMISYRIVEYHVSDADPTKFVDNEAIKDYEPAEYYDAQAFELTSETSKSVEGWQIYEDSSSGKTYVKRGDELYYEVDSTGAISDAPADPQPDEDRLVAQTSIEYRTADKGIAYQMADVRNYHEPKYVYVEVGKEWNDAGIKDVTTGDNVNQYVRKNLKFVLKGKTTDGAVDINGDADGNDLVTIIKENENKDRTAAEAGKKIDDYQVFEKENDSSERYAWVKGKEGKEDGYYKIVNGAVDYNDTNAPYSNLKDLVAIGAFKKDDDNFGMRFDDLPTHDGGKPITYTVTEYFEIEAEDPSDPSTWIEAGEKEIAWVTTGGELKEVRIIDGNTSKVVGYTSDFINTPTIEDVYETIPLVILKQDVVTENPLESAEFTIYRKSTGSKAFDKNDLYEVEGQTIYYNQNDTVEYVLRKKDGQPDSDERLYYHTFAEDPENPGQYIYTYVTAQPDASELTVKKQMVESNVITTKTNGKNTFNILLPGNYEVRETKAPTGYTADPGSYMFGVDRNLKKITLESYDDEHETKWWKKLWDLLFRDGLPNNAEGRWERVESKKGGQLTVNDQPIDANILVRKYWEDNDDQDGVRPEDGDANMPKVILEWTTAAHTATGLPVYTDAKGKVKYVHNQSDNKYYKVTKEDEYGKYVTSDAQPQPDADKLTEVADTTCQGRKVYKDQDDKWYVYVDEKYHELEKDTDNNYLVDTQGTVESTPAARQPKESELRLVMDEGAGWQTTRLYNETSKAYDKEAKAPVNYADGPVLTHQHDAYTWNDVPAYRDGKPVVYRVSEESPLLDDGTYRLKSSHTSDTKEKVFTLINNSGENVSTHNQTVDVTNRHETRIINIDAYKVWNDDNPTKRKESTLTLWKEVNGARSIVSKTEGGHTTDDTGTVPTTDETDPVKTWSDLPVFERGYPIKYTIVEESIDGYRTEYELDYTKEDGTDEGEEVHEKSDTVDAEDVKRTYYQGATDKKISGETVYTDGTNEYVKRGDDYYEVTGETIADSPADPQPDGNDLEVAKNDDSDIPSGVDKEPGDESTTASFTIENEETIDIPIKKTWIDGANANVTFQLWRTTTKEEDLTSSVLGDVKEYELTSNPDTKISVAQYRALSDADKALYTPVKRIICYQHNEAGNYISVQDYDELPTSEKSEYTAVEGSEWSPYDPADPSKTVDGWERADDIQHEFLSRDFENKHTPGFSVEETFKNLPRQKIETAEGKTIYKEKTGTNPKKYVLMEDPEATGQDIGKQFYFTFTVDEETGEYTYTKANPQPNRDDLQVSYLAYMYRVFEVPKLVRYTADQTSDFNITNYNLRASNGFAKVEVVKELEGRKWDVNGTDEFYFELEPISAEDKTNPSHRISDDDIPLPSRMVNNRPVYKDANDKRYVIDGDDLYREVDDNDKVADKPANPQPKADNLARDGTINASINYPIDTSKDKAVGAIGRAVDFKSIEFSDESVVPRGNTVEFNYKVREVYDMLGTSIDDATDHTGKRNGITYAGKVEGGVFKPEEHDLKIVVKNDDSGKMTTEIYWDGNTQAGAVPVYTNKYSSESEAKAWIEKEIKTRKWEDYDKSAKTGDAFRYEVLAISGSQLNVPGADHSGTDDSYPSKPLISNESGNPQEDIQQESENEYAFGLTGNKYTGDMLNSNGEGYFIYAIREMDEVHWSEDQLIGGLNFDHYKVDGLEYDEETIYAKVKVNDNWDGTLRFEVKYYSDAACRTEITDYQVWIEDKFTGGTVDVAVADPQPTASNLIATKDTLDGKTVYYDKTNKKRYVKKEVDGEEYCYEVVYGTEGKKLMSQDDIKAMEDEHMTQDQKDANGYRQVNVAHFINRETVDIPITKEWVGGPAVEDVNLHLKRHLFELKDEEHLDSTAESTDEYLTGDDFVKSAENRWTDTEKPFWQPVGLTRIVKRGAFLDSNGEPKYDDDEKTISSQTYGDLKADDGSALEKEDYIEGFNKDLPKYVKVDGKIYRAVYKLEEDDTSDAYKGSYKRVEESETPGGDPVVKKDAQIYINSGTLVVTNKVTATNTANIAAVKQLLGRGWMNTDDIKDDFEFEIEALGKGKYNKDTGKFVSVDTSAEAKAAVPMPGHYKNKNDDDDVISIEAYNALTDEQKANYEYVGNNKEAHAKEDDTTVDPNGNLERLARFDSIEYKVTDLTYDPSDKHMQGDFFYVIREKIPDDATIEVTEGDTTRTVTYAEATVAQKAAGGFKKNGITYDGTEHIVHVKVRENRTGKLQTQISYDENPKYNSEDYKADITTGTQFTPVFTNKYTSEVDVEVKGNKYIMGRDWKEGDNFDFVMIPMAGAPFKDANRSDFPANDTNTDREREAALEDKDDGIAIHNKDGEHVMRLFVDKNEDVQEFSFPKIKVKSEDLHKITDAESQAAPKQGETDKRIRDKDGNVLPTGVTYGQFMYAIAETAEFDKLNADSVEDLIKDSDTEYARVTVYDPGNGVLEYRVDIFEDRYGNIPRYKPNPETGEETKIPADAVTFVNKLDRDLTAIKAWDGTPTEDVTLKLQWSVLGDSSWHDVESTEWFPNIDGTKIIRKNATGDELKATWPKLPTYANISEYDDMSGESGDNIELNDMWIYYRVVEDPEPAQAAVYYNEVAYKEGDTPNTTIIVEGVEKDKYSEDPYHTGPEKDEHDEYLKPEKRVHTLHVTNFPTNNNVKASFGVVKQFIGRAWDKEEFQFTAEPVMSRLGGATEYINNGTYYKKGPKPDEMDQETYDAAADILYKEAYEELSDGPVKELYSEKQNSMPKEFVGNDNTATAKKSDDKKLKVSVNEYAANFKDLTIYRSDLAFNPATKKMEGEFVYKIKEVIPANADKTDDYVEDADGNKFYYYVVNDGKGNNIKYTSEEHFVTIKAVDEGSGNITTTVTYDGRKSGEYVPVYTNYALMPTPITGTKTWIGGKESEHVNGKVTLNADNTQIVKTEATAEKEGTPKDDLGLKLTRKLPGEQDYNVVTQDDAKRPLVIIWAKEKRTTHPRDFYFKSGDPAVVAGKTYYSYDVDTDTYTAVTNTEGKSPSDEGWFEKTVVTDYDFEYEKQETGNGTYTIKAVVTKDGETTYVDPLLKTVDDDGNEYDYKISETKVPDDKYKESINGLDVTNTHKVEDNLKVTKTWDDAQDAEGLRPEEVIVHLYKEVIVPATTEGGEATTKTVQVEVDKKSIKYDEAKDPDEHTWSTGVVFDNLPLYDSNGNVIKYYVLEEGVAGYTATYAANSTAAGDYKDEENLVKIELDGQKDRTDPESETDNPQFIDIKNSLTPATDTVEVTKVWKDNDNNDGKRPEDVTFKLYKYVWDEDDGAYDTNKKLVSGKGLLTSATGRPATKEDVEAAKVKDPTSKLKVGDFIKIEDLVLDGTVDDPTDTEANETAAWKGSWVNLPLEENGKTIIYVVEEDTGDSIYAAAGSDGKVPEGKYDKNPCITGDQVNGYTVKNVYTPETTTATITKSWVDNNNSLNTRPAVQEFTLMRTYKGTEKIDGTDDYKLIDPERAKDASGADVPVLKLSAEDASNANTWTETINGLPKYIRINIGTEQAPDYASREITYLWQETVPTGYTATGKYDGAKTAENPDGDVSKKGDGSASIIVNNNSTLTNTAELGTIEVVKTWDDVKDKDGKRSAAITAFESSLTLFAGDTKVADGGSTGVTKTINTDATAGKTTVKWTGLPIYNGSGNQINYTVTEGVIPEYSLTAGPTPSPATIPATGEKKGSIALTNKHIPDTTSLTIAKTWVDDNNADGLRATTAEYKDQMKLYRTTQKAIDEGTAPENVTSTYSDNMYMSVRDNGDNTYTVIWNNLPAVDDEEETYIYSAAEILPANSYYAAETGTGSSKVTEQAGQADAKEIAIDKTSRAITNTQTLQDVEVRKIWADKVNSSTDPTTDDEDAELYSGKRPTSIKLILTGDDGDSEAATPVEPTKKEATINSSTPDATDTTAGFTEGGWSGQTFVYKFNKVPVYAADGEKKITYTLSEDEVPNYTRGYMNPRGELGTPTVINTYKLAKITGTKVWKDGGLEHNTSKELKGKLTVNWKTVNGEGVEATGTVSDPHIDWSGDDYTIAGLPEKDADGNIYTYWVTETAPDAKETEDKYVVSYKDKTDADAADGAANEGKIINTLSGTTNIEGTKTWENDPEGTDHDNKTEVVLTLKRKSAASSEATVYGTDASNKDDKGRDLVIVWTDEDSDEDTFDEKYSFMIKNPDYEVGGTEPEFIDPVLNKYDADGNKYTYTITEDKIAGYATSYSDDTFDITNTYGNITSSPTDKDITLKKVYKEKDDRGDEIALKKGEFKYTLTGQPKDTNGSTVDATGMNAAGTNETSGKITMDQIAFSKLGKYAFELAETDESATRLGVTFDKTKYILMADVTDGNKDGEWEIKWSVVAKDGEDLADPETEETFKNYYNDLKIEEEVKVKKELTGHKIDNTYKFEFVLFGGPKDRSASGLDDEITLEGVTKGGSSADWDETTKKATEVVTFTDDDKLLTFTLDDLKQLDGTYATERKFEYLVYEKAGNVNGVIYDAIPQKLTATLKFVKADAEDDEATEDIDESKDHLEVTWSPKADGTGITFKNKYDPSVLTSSVTDTYDALKVIDDKDNKSRTPKANEFLFKFTGNQAGVDGSTEDASGIEMLATNDKDGNIVFGKVPFDKAGTYTFTLKELSGQDKSIATYDTTERKVKAVVTFVDAVEEDNPDTDIDETIDHLEVTWTVTGEGVDDTATPKPTVTFTNRTTQSTVNKPVRISWVNDTDMDDTTAASGTHTANDRPTSVTVTLQEKKTVYVYNNKDYATEAEAKAAADTDQGADPGEGDYSGITAVEKWTDVTKKADGTTVPSSIKLTSSNNLDRDGNNWGDTTTWTELPKYDADGNKIEYRVIQSAYESASGNVTAKKADKEGKDEQAGPDNKLVAKDSTLPVKVAGYSFVDVTVPIADGLATLVNTYETMTITGTKTWNDAEPSAHNNRSEVTLIVKRTDKDDPKAGDWTTLQAGRDYHVDWSDDNDATWTIKGLTRYVDATSTEYKYQVTEQPISGYSTTYKAGGSEVDALGNSGGEIINTAGKITVEAVKVWDGDNDAKSGRKDVRFQLFREIDGAKKKVGDATLTADKTAPAGDDAGSVKWEDQPIKNGSKDVIYTVEEKEPEGYKLSKTEYQDDEGNWTESKPAKWNGKIRFTNSLVDTTVDVPVRKVWVDNDDQDDVRPDSIKVRIYIDANNNGKYDDGEQVKVKNGKLDDTGTVVADLELKDSNNWKRLFKDLPKTDTNGKAVTYKVAEMDDGTAKEDGDTAFDGKYNVSIKGDMAGGYVITNSNDPDTVSVTVTKQWYGDAGVKEDTRKDVKVFLIGYISDDHKDQPAYIGVYQTIKVDKDADEETDAGSVTWDGLPKYIGGQELIWTAIEDSVPGYTTSYDVDEIDENNVVNITVKNDYYGPVNKVTATKIWQDGNNRDGKRDDVWFQLYRKIGDGEEEKVDDPIKVDVNRSAADGTDAGKVTWDNLPEIIAETKYDGTTEDVYERVDPAPAVGSPITEEWYEPVGSDSYKQTEDKTVQAGKTYYIKTTEPVKKEMPERSVVYWVKEVNEDGDEAAPDGYTSTVVQTEPGVFEVQNIHVPEKKDIVVKKIWNDDNDEDKIRPDHVTLKLKDGSTVVAKAILTEDDNWAHTFEGMPVKKNGEKINYTVEEDSVAGYTASGPAEGQDGSSENPFTITNTRNRKLVDVKVKKVWAGDEGHEAETRGDVKVNLVEVADGARKVIDTQTLTFDASDPDKEMSYEWKSQPTHRSGKDITYEVTENDVDDYTMTGNEMEVDAQGNYSITITNTYGHIASHDVIYVDPKNNDGEMILKSDKYSPKEAQKQAQGKLSPPANPSHKGTKFIGWAVNYDDKGNWVLVAKYQDNPVKPVPTISYIDPQSGKVIVSKQTDDPSSVKPPANPKAKNMQFVKWQATKDAAGNTIYVAQFECDCRNGGGKDVDKSNVDTGDDAMLTVWMLLFVMAVSFMVLTMMLRNRGINAVRDTYKPKH